MELTEGMYVRTKDGIIGTYLGKEYIKTQQQTCDVFLLKTNTGWGDNGLENIWCKDISIFIKKSSNDIIDLIEERDFVKVRIDGIFINWFMVDLFEDENENQELGIGCYEDGLLNSISEYRPLNTLEILEVVTKEQFESMSYKVN